MEVITPLGVPRSFSTDPSVAAPHVRFKSIKAEGALEPDHRDFPDPRLFDFDDNGTVDANDIIQEHQTRIETREAINAKTPLAKYVVQLQDAKAETQPAELPVPPLSPSKISVFA